MDYCGHKEAFRDDGYVHFLDHGDHFAGLYRHQNSPDFTF